MIIKKISKIKRTNILVVLFILLKYFVFEAGFLIFVYKNAKIIIKKE